MTNPPSLGSSVNRIAAPDPSDLSPDQQSVSDAISSGPRGGLIGPFGPLLHSPGLADRMQRTGEYLRFVSDLDRSVFEFAVLVVARHRDQAFEWAHHAPIALRAGVPSDVIEAVAEGDKAAVVDPFAQLQTFVTGLLDHNEIPDSLVSELIVMHGHAGVMDLVVAVGYYSTLAMVMEVAGTPAPAAGPFLP